MGDGREKVNGAIWEPALPPRNECRTVGEWGGLLVFTHGT